jgi:Flp pilus assembly protein TadD
MRTLLFLSFILLLSSCSSTPKKMKDVTEYAEDDLSWVKNDDFKPVATIAYNMREDFFTGDIVEVDSLAKESVERAPKNELKKVERAGDPVAQIAAHCHQGQYEAGFKIVDEVYAKYKEHPGYWNQVGTCYLSQGKNRQAQLYYNKAMDIEADFAPAVNNLGVIYYREGHYQKALTAFQKAAEVNQFSLTPSFNLSQIYLQYGFIAEAEQLLIALWRQNSTDVDVLNGLGTIQLLKNDANRAIQFYRQIPRQLLQSPQVALNYAVALKMADRQRDAEGVLSNMNSSDLGKLQNYSRSVDRFVRN